MRSALTWIIFNYNFYYSVHRVNWYCTYTFSDLPEVKTITVQIYKETDGKNKKEKRKPVGETFQFAPSTLPSHSEVECSHAVKILIVL